MSEQDRVRRAAPWITRRLRVGLAWLWSNRRQPRGAMIEEIQSRAGECQLIISPACYKDMPVITLEVQYWFAEHGRPEGRLMAEEVEAFTALLERAALQVGRAQILDVWGGAGAATASFQLSRRCGKGPAQLLKTLRRGCQKLGHELVCSWDGCTWFADGYKKARLPKGWR